MRSDLCCLLGLIMVEFKLLNLTSESPDSDLKCYACLNLFLLNLTFLTVSQITTISALITSLGSGEDPVS